MFPNGDETVDSPKDKDQPQSLIDGTVHEKTPTKPDEKTPTKEPLTMRIDLSRLRIASGTPVKSGRSKSTKKPHLGNADDDEWESEDDEGTGDETESMDEGVSYMLPNAIQAAVDKTINATLSTLMEAIKQTVDTAMAERFDRLEQKLEQRLDKIESCMSQIVEKQDSMERELSTVKARLDHQVKSVAEMSKRLDKVENSLKSSKVNVIESVEEQINMRLSDSTNTSVREIELREAKKLNIMLFNVAESTGGSEEEKSREDAEKIVKIQKDMGTSVPLTNVIRIGKASTGKIRPLRVTAPDTSAHIDLLRSAKNLRNSTSFSTVFIKRDMTPLERSQWKALIKEKKEKQVRSNENGENVRWVIYRGRVVPST